MQSTKLWIVIMIKLLLIIVNSLDYKFNKLLILTKMANNNILIYKIGKDNCSSCILFDSLKKNIQDKCPYPILSIDYKNIDQLSGRVLTIDGHTVKVPVFNHYITSFPMFFIYDNDTLVSKFLYKLSGLNSINSFINKVNSIMEAHNAQQ